MLNILRHVDQHFLGKRKYASQAAIILNTFLEIRQKTRHFAVLFLFGHSFSFFLAFPKVTNFRQKFSNVVKRKAGTFKKKAHEI